MKTITGKGNYLSTCALLASFWALDVLAENDEQQLKAMQEERAYAQQQQAFEQQDTEQEKQTIEQERRYIEQQMNAERRQAKKMQEQEELHLQAMEKPKPTNKEATEEDLNPQATQIEIDEELEKYDEKLKLQSAY